MAADFGLLVGRFNTGTPALSADNDLRELRLDPNGRLHTRLSDGNDNTPSYFADGDAVGSGVGDHAGTAEDRGLLVLGKNDTDSNYQILRVNDDGSLVVSFQAGTEVSEAADKGNANDGEVALVVGTWVLIQELAVPTGQININGWSYTSDKNTIFQMCLVDDTGADGSDRADITEILDSMITTSARPSDHVSYQRALARSGGTNIKVAIFAKQLQSGAAGVGLSMINANTTT